MLLLLNLRQEDDLLSHFVAWFASEIRRVLDAREILAHDDVVTKRVPSEDNIIYLLTKSLS